MKTNILFFRLLMVALISIQNMNFSQAAETEVNTPSADELDARTETGETTEYNADKALALFTNDAGEVDWDGYFLYIVNMPNSSSTPIISPSDIDNTPSVPSNGTPNTGDGGNTNNPEGSEDSNSTTDPNTDGNGHPTDGSNPTGTDGSETPTSPDAPNNSGTDGNPANGSNSTSDSSTTNNGSENNTTDTTTNPTNNGNNSSGSTDQINDNVSSVNQSVPPVAPNFYADYEVSTYPNTAVIISFNDIVGSHDWYIPDGIKAIREPLNGELYYNHDNTITYTPNHGFAGVDTFYLPNSDGSSIVIAVRIRNDYNYWDFLGAHNDDGYWGDGYGWFKNSDDEWFFDGDYNWQFEGDRWNYHIGSNGGMPSNAQYLGHWGQPDDPAYWSVPVQCKPAPRFYAVHDEGISDSQLLSIDPWSQKSKNIGPMQIEYDIEGIDISPTNYRLYAISGNENDPTSQRSGVLHIINPRTGAMTVVGNTGYKNVTALAFDLYGGLWGWAKGKGIIKINPNNGRSYLYAGFHLTKVDGLAWSSDGEVLYASAKRDLWMYSKKSRTLSTVCENVKLLPGDRGRIEALETFGDGMLLMATHQNANNLLYIFDPVKCEVVAFKEFESNYPDIESIAWSCQVNQSTRHPTNSLNAQPPLLVNEIRNYFEEIFGEGSATINKKKNTLAITITDEYGKTQVHNGLLSAYLPAVPGYNGPAEFLPLLNEYGQHLDLDGDGHKDYTFTYSDGRMQLVLYLGTKN